MLWGDNEHSFSSKKLSKTATPEIKKFLFLIKKGVHDPDIPLTIAELNFPLDNLVQGNSKNTKSAWAIVNALFVNRKFINPHSFFLDSFIALGKNELAEGNQPVFPTACLVMKALIPLGDLTKEQKAQLQEIIYQHKTRKELTDLAELVEKTEEKKPKTPPSQSIEEELLPSSIDSQYWFGSGAKLDILRFRSFRNADKWSKKETQEIIEQLDLIAKDLEAQKNANFDSFFALAHQIMKSLSVPLRKKILNILVKIYKKDPLQKEKILPIVNKAREAQEAKPLQRQASSILKIIS